MSNDPLYIQLEESVGEVRRAADGVRLWAEIAEQFHIVSIWSDRCSRNPGPADCYDCLRNRLFAVASRYVGGETLGNDLPALIALIADHRQFQCERHANETAAERNNRR